MRGSLEKLAVASRLAVHHPTELIDRVVSRWEARSERFDLRYDGVDWQVFVRQLGAVIGQGALASLDETVLAELERELVRLTPVLDQAPFGPLPSADLMLAKTCYMLCRAIQPECIVETGVAYGMSSSFFLAALEANGKGVLHSIDLPALVRNADHYVGALVPDRFRGRWRFHRGSTRRVLPRLIAEIDAIDIFLHDSLHTYTSVSQDLCAVTPHLAANAAVVVDDVDLNGAFSRWVSRIAPSYSAIVRESQKRSMFGVGIFKGST